MKKERFKNIGTDIFHYGEWWCSAGGEHCADVIATAMNEIMDKNAQLKKDNKEYIRGLDLRRAECQSWASDVRELREQNCQLEKENGQLTQQLQIFEKFLEGNDLSIDWEEFCGLEECAFENPNFSCKTCIYLKGDE